ASGHRGEFRARAQLVVVLARAHVVRRLDVDGAHVLDEHIQHFLGLEAVVAVLEIDVVRRELELCAHRGPERLVLGERGGGHGCEGAEKLRTEHHPQRRATHCAEKIALVHHWSPYLENVPASTSFMNLISPPKYVGPSSYIAMWPALGQSRKRPLGGALAFHAMA